MPIPSAEDAAKRIDEDAELSRQLDRLVEVARMNMVEAGRQTIFARAESPPPSPRRSLWTRVRQLLCPHPATTSVRIPGATPVVYRRHCHRCGAAWCEKGWLHEYGRP